MFHISEHFFSFLEDRDVITLTVKSIPAFKSEFFLLGQYELRNVT